MAWLWESVLNCHCCFPSSDHCQCGSFNTINIFTSGTAQHDGVAWSLSVIFSHHIKPFECISMYNMLVNHLGTSCECECTPISVRIWVTTQQGAKHNIERAPNSEVYSTFNTAVPTNHFLNPFNRTLAFSSFFGPSFSEFCLLSIFMCASLCLAGIISFDVCCIDSLTIFQCSSNVCIVCLLHNFPKHCPICCVVPARVRGLFTSVFKFL